MYRRVWSEIDLEALRHNLRVLQSRLSGVGIWAVVKADAYGHGALRVGATLAAAGVEGLAVASLDEALRLREGGVGGPVLVLGETPPEGIGLLQRHGVSQCLFRPEHLDGWQEGLDNTLPPPGLHIKVDTGMGRLGIPATGLPRLVDELARGPFRGEGVFTHFALAESDPEATRASLDAFRRGLEEARLLERFPECRRHAANSAAALLGPEYWLDAVRLGLLLYGVSPEAAAGGSPPVLPVMGVKASLVDMKTVAAGKGFGYGHADRAAADRRLGVVPIGYADGYLRQLSGRAQVLVRGARAPVVGAVSMDFLHVDISAIPDARVGDQVVLLGRQDDGEITLHDLARWGETIPYEMMTLLGKRAPRVFLAAESPAGVG